MRDGSAATRVTRAPKARLPVEVLELVPADAGGQGDGEEREKREHSDERGTPLQHSSLQTTLTRKIFSIAESAGITRRGDPVPPAQDPSGEGLETGLGERPARPCEVVSIPA